MLTGGQTALSILEYYPGMVGDDNRFKILVSWTSAPARAILGDTFALVIIPDPFKRGWTVRLSRRLSEDSNSVTIIIS